MDQAEITMLENLHKNTGKSIEEWIDIVNKENFEKHGEIIKFLKEKHAFTHGFANMVAHKAKASDSGSKDNKDELVDNQYKGKEHFRPVYNQLISEIKKMGNDIEIAPKNAYVSIRRKKQFAILQPATKNRFEIGINLKGEPPKGMLELVNKSNSMCSHIIKIDDQETDYKEIMDWMRKAYENAK